ncbi:phage holin family protein [Desulforamulus ruminis]|uniref:phage holin family protein n=1 Tax=Desulforamulus ruminis TaxID=1564 RepID=UPI002FD9F9D5
MDNKIVSFIMATSGTIGIYFFGGFDLIIQSLIIFMVLDYITGIASAFINKSLSSTAGFKGILRKVGIFLVITVAHFLDMATGLEEPLFRTMTIWFYITNEGLSILENLGKIGVPMPSSLVKVLEKLQINKSKQ